MFSIYENANSVFSKNIRIKLTDKKHLYSGIYITFACKLNFKQIGIIGRICETLLNDIAFKDLIPNLHESIEKQATKSAISQVMARNMSHNIGSHVMNKLIGDLRSLELLDFEKDKTSYKSSKLTELHSKIEEKLKKDDWYNKANDKLKGRALKNEIALKLISDFNSYVKCRMDYLADLTFGTPAMLSSKMSIRIFSKIWTKFASC
ncbi:MAG: hypothetical protein IPJ26_13805 [Bacteroidetes bacterium]|nr:hypothetical protein [Bacteroidota bacterium]